MIPEDRLQDLLGHKDAICETLGYATQPEGWAICDGALVIYDLDNPPEWFKFERDEDGNSV